MVKIKEYLKWKIKQYKSRIIGVIILIIGLIAFTLNPVRVLFIIIGGIILICVCVGILEVKKDYDNWERNVWRIPDMRKKDD